MPIKNQPTMLLMKNPFLCLPISYEDTNQNLTTEVGQCVSFGNYKYGKLKVGILCIKTVCL